MISDNNNFFELFNLAINFKIDLDLLEENYYALIKKFHPDNHSGTNQSPLEKIYLQQKTAEIHQAYNLLKHPITRAIYLLKLNNIFLDECELLTDKAFLTWQFELREKLSKNQQLSSQDKTEISDLYQKLIHNLEILFSKNQLNTDNIINIKNIIYKLQFLEKIR